MTKRGKKSPTQRPALTDRTSPAARFRLQCPCGEWVTGWRRRRQQVEICPHCGYALFVLPESPFPPPQDTPRQDAHGRDPDSRHEEPAPTTVAQPLSAKTSDSSGADQAPSISSEPLISPDVRPASEVPTKPRERPASADAALNASQRDTREPQARATASGRSAEVWQPARRSWLRRPRTLLLALLALVLGTVTLAWRTRHRESLVETLRDKAASGKAAYYRGDYAAAKKDLHEAMSALQSLGPSSRAVEEVLQEQQAHASMSILHAYREADLFEALLVIPLQELIKKAHQAYQTEGLEAWQREFGLFYRGRAVIIDAPIVPIESSGPPAWEIPFLLEHEGAFFRLRAEDLEILHKRQWEKPQRVIFGARLASLEPDPDDPTQWAIRLQPGSGVFLTYWPTLQRLAWTADDLLVSEENLQQILARQREWVASGELPEHREDNHEQSPESTETRFAN